MVAKNPRRDIIVAELERWEVIIDGDFAGGKHRYIQCLLSNGSRLKFHYSGGGKEHQLRNVRHDVRRQLSRLGQKLKPECERQPKETKVIPIRSAPPILTPRAVLPLPVQREEPQQQETKVMTEDKKPRVQMSFAQIGTVMRLLQEHSEKTVKGVDYKDGWSDERIVGLVNAAHSDRMAIDDGHVKRLRTEAFPDWVKRQSTGSPGSGMGAIWSSMRKLEARVQALEDAATTPKQNGTISYGASVTGLNRQ